VIVAAGLTPALQQIMCFDRLRPGEVNRAREVAWCPSGKNINVGMALAALGEEAATLSPLGGRTGQAIAHEFTQRGLAGRWTTMAAPTRVCTTLLDRATATTTELVQNAGPLSEAELGEFRAAYRETAARADVVVLTGSLPHGTPATFYRELLRNTGCPVVLDGRGPELLAALECRPRVVKPNREELGMTVSRSVDDEAGLRAAVHELLDRGAQAVVVTQGKEAVWVAEGEGVWRLTPPAVEPVVNPIGCGDCLAAGIAVGLRRGWTVLEAVRFGMAAAADNVTQLLPACLDPRRVEKWRARIEVRE
jgi:tagatose 6-phosphate kinase